MTSLPEQYLDTMRQSQEAVLNAVDTWTKSVQQTFGQTATTPMGSGDSNQIIDQVFDFAEKMLEMQRQFAKNLAAASTSAAAAVGQTGESSDQPGS